ncbi:MAG TPA: MauE/DoxX family redox-associated membrane protein [Solirubrobacteraceae bacterium]|nr:MauE/DoxX family redox-associated membrane protein [Solirubrobacteraceae bacterium]
MTAIAALGSLVVGAVLASAGSFKLARPRSAADALVDLGHTGALSHPSGMRALGIVEICAGAGAIALVKPAQILAAAMLWLFAAWLCLAVARGRSGAPCPCFGAKTSVGPRGALTTSALAALATWACVDRGPALGTTSWLALACATLACIAIALACVAFLLAREVAVLRKRTAPRVALEILEEGPPIGEECPLIERFPVGTEELALAVFVSPGCRICRELEPAIAQLALDPEIKLLVFDEHHDQLAWHTAQIPGSPYAVVMAADGMTMAKGTFNTLEQLESVPASARTRLAARLARV